METKYQLIFVPTKSNYVTVKKRETGSVFEGTDEDFGRDIAEKLNNYEALQARNKELEGALKKLLSEYKLSLQNNIAVLKHYRMDNGLTVQDNPLVQEIETALNSK